VNLAEELAPELGTATACGVAGAPKATVYRRRQPPTPPAEPRPPRAPPKRTLADSERAEVLALLNDSRFVDKAPAEVHATLLDEGRYLCSPRTMYRLLDAYGQVRERRNQLRHPAYAKPELLATRPNQAWSWDITKLRGPSKGVHFSLYVILDIFSRYVVGWYVTTGESGAVAQDLFRQTCEKQLIAPGQVTVHADRGGPMKSKPLVLFLADLNLTKSYSRPHVSNDNPYSESHFKTLKYRPEFPDRFGSLPDARAFCRLFFAWYNDDHRHSGIAMLTPAQVHQGRADTVVHQRQLVLEAAFRSHPERFINGPPRAHRAPAEAWINKPTTEPALQ
jgi:putative transposase